MPGWAQWQKWGAWDSWGAGGALLYSISGYILDGASVGISGVTVTLTGDESDSTTTDVNGFYEFTNLPPGSYTVTPTLADHTFYPTSSAETITADDVVSSFVGTEWLLYDEFTTPESAPLASPRTCEPGPGTLTIVDTGDNLDIISGELIGSGRVNYGDPRVYGGWTQAARVVGVAASAKSRWSAVGDDLVFGLGDSITAKSYFLIENSTLKIWDESDSVNLGIALSQNTWYSLLVIARSLGTFYVVDGVLGWVNKESTLVRNLDVVTAYNGWVTPPTDSRFDDVGALSLAANGYAEWDADFSTVTDTKSAPATTTAYDCDADFHNQTDFTHETGQYVLITGRHTDGNNYIGWIVSGDNIQLRKRVGGSISTLATGVGAFSDGVAAKVDLVAEGSTVTLFVDNVLITTQTITDFLTVEGGAVFHNLATNDIVLSTHPYPALGIATDRVIAPQSSDTFTHTDNFLCYQRVITLPVTARTYLDFRRVDVNNRLYLYITNTGVIRLYEEILGADNIRINTGVATVSDNDDIALVVEGANAELFVNRTSVGSTAAIATILTGTAGTMPTGGVSIDSIELFPRDVSDLLPVPLV